MSSGCGQEPVGALVGAAVGALVGDAVGALVGDAVGALVGEPAPGGIPIRRLPMALTRPCSPSKLTHSAGRHVCGGLGKC